jgi:Leucine-rich repeat (LRR) protein
LSFPKSGWGGCTPHGRHSIRSAGKKNGTAGKLLPLRDEENDTAVCSRWSFNRLRMETRMINGPGSIFNGNAISGAGSVNPSGKGADFHSLLIQWRDDRNRLGDEDRAQAVSRIEHAIRTGARSLDLSGLGLTSLPPGIGKLQSLEQLHVDNNRLVCLPSEISNLKKLWELTAGHNELESVPAEIWQMPGLQVISLESNKIAELPPAPETPPVNKQPPRRLHLQNKPPRVLHLQDNKLTSLPKHLLEEDVLKLDRNPLNEETRKLVKGRPNVSFSERPKAPGPRTARAFLRRG